MPNLKPYTTVFVIFLIMTGSFTIASAGDGILKARIDRKSIDRRLAPASEFWSLDLVEDAIREVETQIEADSTLIPQAAIIMGGNYHLMRLTDNVYADRVGDFSPSGDKLVYARDTSLMRLNDGLFDWYEDRTTGIFYYDFTIGQEITPQIDDYNAFKPRFFSNSSFFYLTGGTSNPGSSESTLLHLYDIESGTSVEHFPLSSQNYCPYADGIIYYNSGDETFVMKNLNNLKEKVLFDNDDIFSFRRPLPLIQNLSVGEDIIIFQAGHNIGRVITNIYGLPVKGGKPKKMTDQQVTFGSDLMFYPAAVNGCEFACLSKNSGGIDIYYHSCGEVYRLTFDGGDKFYLAISPDGSRIAYSYMPADRGVETYEVFILDFNQDADINDLKYRLNTIR